MSGAQARVAVRSRRLEGELAAFKMLLFTLLVGLGAQVAVPLPPDGVPMTLQTLFVVLAALCIGPKLGTGAMLLYIATGMIGAGVFAQGEAGLAVLAGQTGGYFVGFVACQPVIHALVKRPDGSVRGWLALVAAVLAGHLVIFAVGVPWLGFVRGFTVERALAGGFYPFVPWMLVKAALAVLIGLRVHPRAVRRLW